MEPETAKPETAPSVEPPKSEPLPAIVEAAFGKEAAAPSKPEPPKPEPPPEPKAAAAPKPEPAAAPAPSAEAAPASKPNGGRENKRVQQLANTIRSKDARISELESELEKLKGKEAPESAVERKFAEKELEQALRAQEEAYGEIMSERLAEAFPDEASRQEFLELSCDFGPAIDKYAPQVSQLIIGSDISYKLANAFYTVLASDANAIREFLNMPFSVQRKEIGKLEAYLKNPPPAAPAASAPQPPQAPQAPAAPAAVPKSIVPSESGSQASGTPDPYQSTLDRIAEQNRKAYGR